MSASSTKIQVEVVTKMDTNSRETQMKFPRRGIIFKYTNLRDSLRKLRSLRSFLIYILPISLLLGLVFPEASGSLNSLGLSLVQLISFPAIPLVLAAVILSTRS